jgi:hypothetical protein
MASGTSLFSAIPETKMIHSSFPFSWTSIHCLSKDILCGGKVGGMEYQLGTGVSSGIELFFQSTGSGIPDIDINLNCERRWRRTRSLANVSWKTRTSQKNTDDISRQWLNGRTRLNVCP